MSQFDSRDQTILEFSQGTFILAAIDSFLTDKQAAGLSPVAVRFYRQFLKSLNAYF